MKNEIHTKESRLSEELSRFTTEQLDTVCYDLSEQFLEEALDSLIFGENGYASVKSWLNDNSAGAAIGAWGWTLKTVIEYHVDMLFGKDEEDEV